MRTWMYWAIGIVVVGAIAYYLYTQKKSVPKPVEKVNNETALA